MAEKTPPATSPPPAPADLALEAVGGAILAVGLAVVLGVSSRWLGDAVFGTEGFEDIVRVLFGGLLGIVIGVPVGAWLVARRREQRFSLMLAFGGTFLAAALSITLPTVIAGSSGSTATPWVAAVMCTLGAVVFGNLKTWMNR